ncbi:MAG: MarR family transcriptional regulator [Sphingobium sp.]|nr:MarR family transcriptional regulator [Sphingobium sp.]
MLGQTSLADAPDRLSHIVDVDMLVLRCDGHERGLDLLLTRLDSMAMIQGTDLVVITSLGGLDIVHALVRSDRAVILCEPDVVDLVSVMAAHSATSAPQDYHLNDIGREAGENRLERMSEELGRLSRTIEALVQGRSPSQPPALAWSDGYNGENGDGPTLHSPGRDFKAFPKDIALSDAQVTAAQVRSVLRVRRLREQIFPEGLFADPAWDILLDLMAARMEKNRVSVSSLCIAAAVPPTTALRWIRHLTDCNLLERQADPEDGRRIFIALSDKGTSLVLRWFQESASHMGYASGLAASGQGEGRKANGRW